VAGAGTGKTTVITERINYLITEKKINPEEILALTFTEKAAAEMEERVDKALPLGYFDLWISTFHSFAQRILEEHGLEIGLTTDFKLVDQTESWLLIRNNLDKFDLDYYKPRGNPTKFIHALIKHFSRCKDELITPQDYLKHAEKFRLDNDLRKDEEAALEVRRLEEVANAYHTYQQLLLDNDLLDFGDLINYCLELFEKRPTIIKKYQKQFQYILIDEFQDTNYAQYQLIKLLGKPRNNITVVGDDDQSVYKFRGASVSNILEFKKDYPKAKDILLNTNYRSKQNILDLAYNFIQLNNPNRLEVKLKVANKKLSKKLNSASEGKGVIEHIHAETLDDEMAAVINKIQEIGSHEKGISWNDFAILVRANNQANLFVQGLEQANLPYQYVASKGLFAKPVVLNLIAFLKLLDDYHESDAMYRVLTMPMWNLSTLEIAQLTYLARKKAWSLWSAVNQSKYELRLPTGVQSQINMIIDIIKNYASLTKTEKVSKIVFDFLNDSGYLKYIDNEEELDKRQDFSYLGQFYKKIKVFEELNDDKTVKNFLKQLGLELESGEQGSMQPLGEDEGPEMVKVMTIHAAKGLEFKYVFLVNMVDRRFPSSERREGIELPEELVKESVPEGDIHMQEERRLFYVAMTRAKKGLFLTSGEDYGGVRKKKLSVFMTDLGFKQTDLKKKNMKVTELEKVKAIKTKKTNYQDLLPKRFSFTQIKDFQSCPRLYYYRYILKIPTQGNHYFSFGTTVHLALQRFFEEAKKRQGTNQGDLFSKKTNDNLNKKPRELVSQAELIKIYENSWIDDWYQNKKQKEDYFKNGKDILKKFHVSPNYPDTMPNYLEKGFSIKVGNYSLGGKIDRIDDLGDSFRIIDYKTGKPKIKLDAQDKEQLLIYQMALESWQDMKIEELVYYYLEDDSLMSFKGTDAQKKKLTDKIVKTIDEIKDFDFEKYIKNHEKCRSCSDIL